MDQTKAKKKTMGRRKIEIKKIEKKSDLQVTLSKRRSGLFKKAGELSILTGADIAILVESPAKKIYSFGNPSVNSVINRYLQEEHIHNHSYINVEDDQKKYLEVMERLKTEREIEKAMKDRVLWKLNNNVKSFYDLGLKELEEYRDEIKTLMGNVMARANEMATGMAMAMATVSDHPSSSMIRNVKAEHHLGGGIVVKHGKD